MKNNDIKAELIEFLENREELFKYVRDNWYKTRCPYCGDTQKRLNEGHFYLWIDLYNDYSIGFNCFRCGEKGSVTSETIELMGGDNTLKQHVDLLNKTSKRRNRGDMIAGDALKYFEFSYPEPKRGEKTKYLENRLGIRLSDEALQKYKVITSLRDFLRLNNVWEYPFSEDTLFRLEDHYVGFLSNGNSHIVFRDITEKEHFGTIKYPITKESMVNKIFYSVTNAINPYTDEELIINLSEGILDIIGVEEHLQKNKDNCISFAVTGRYYDIMIHRLIRLGLVGGNITLNIYSDNDEKFGNKDNSYLSTMAYYRKALSKFKPLYKKIVVWYNTKAKDFGYPKDRISPQMYSL